MESEEEGGRGREGVRGGRGGRGGREGGKEGGRRGGRGRGGGGRARARASDSRGANEFVDGAYEQQTQSIWVPHRSYFYIVLYIDIV